MVENKLTLIIPCYNEEKRLPFAQFEQFAATRPDVRFIFVDDGSKDTTRALLDTFCKRMGEIFPGSARYLALPENMGKSGAVRAGMLNYLENSNENETVGFLDADLATPPGETLRMLDILDKHQRFRCVIGSRLPLLGSRIERNFARQFISRVITLTIRCYLGFPVRDTQCGAKIFRRCEVGAVFAEPFVSRWLFDVEIFMRLKKLHAGINPAEYICELPLIEWRDIKGTNLRFYHGGKIFLELVRIARAYRRK